MNLEKAVIDEFEKKSTCPKEKMMIKVSKYLENKLINEKGIYPNPYYFIAIVVKLVGLSE